MSLSAVLLMTLAAEHGVRPAWSPDSGMVLGEARKTYLYDDSASATLYHDLLASTASGVNEPVAVNGVSDNWLRAFGTQDKPPVYGVIDSIRAEFHDQPMMELENVELWSVCWRSGYVEIDDGKNVEKIPIEEGCGFPHVSAVTNGAATTVTYGSKVAEDLEFDGGSRFLDFESFNACKVVYDAANSTVGADSDVSYWLRGLFVKKSHPGAKGLYRAFQAASDGAIDQAKYLEDTRTARRARASANL